MCSHCYHTLLISWLVAVVRIGAQQDQGGIILFPDDGSLQPEPTENRSPKPEQTISKSAQMCRKYAESVFVKLEGFNENDEDQVTSIDTCVLLEPLIVNGTQAQPREYPHMALIGMASRLGFKWSCGGSLISERFVLSAAHCNPLNPKRVRLGDYNIVSTNDDEEKISKSEEFNIIEVIQHPEYDDSRKYNDITLYKLDRDVKFSEYVRPICLHTEYEIPKSYGIISGWGKVEFGGRDSNVLLKGNVSFVSAAECGKALNPILEPSKSRVLDAIMLCAANFVNGTDSCQGDSGGPLQYRLKDPYCMYSQVGIVSFGVRCGSYEGQPKYPAIYTRVSNYVPWIESIVWP